MISERVPLSELINPTAKQKEFFAASLKYRFLLYGGAGGGGKSYSLRWWCVREVARLSAMPGVKEPRIGLFSMDYPTLIDRQISRIASEMPEWLGEIKRTEREGFNFKLRPDYGGGTIALRNLDDPSKYRSAEFAGIAVEELTENDKATFDDLRFRMRWPGVSRPCFVAATNPGGIGHAWVKQLWIDRDFPSELQPLAPEFGFVSAKVQDNPHLTDQYYQDLLTLPEDKRKAYAEGDWNIFAGQYFPEWRDDVHVVEPFAIPSYWRTWRGGDWGGTSPAAFLWLATDPIGNTYVTDEVYVRGATIRDHSELIRPLDRNRGCTWGILDGACFGDETRDSLGKSIADQYSDCGISWRKGSKHGVGGRVAGWTRIHSLLSTREGTPKLRVFKNCRNLIRTLPGLVHDKIRVEDVDSDGEDHCIVGDTLVLTEHGPKAIRDLVGTSGRVWTVGGQLAEYQHCRMTQGNAEVVRLTFDDGSEVVCTPDHRFMTRKGWKQAVDLSDALRYHELWSSLSRQPSKSSREFGTTSAASTISTRVSDYTEQFGKRLMGLSLRASMCIMWTRIAATIISTTCAWWPDLNMALFTVRTASSPLPLAYQQQLGMALSLDGSGTSGSGKSTLRQSSRSGLQRLARFAARAIAPHGLRGKGLGSATRTAKLVSCEPAGRQNVYCLTVPSTEAFLIEGGLVSHNCPDALRYALGPSEPVAVQNFDTMHPDEADAFRAGMRDGGRPMQEVW